MCSNLWIDVLWTDAAKKILKTLEQRGDAKDVDTFLKEQGWRLLYHERAYKDKIPLWIVLDAYQLSFDETCVLYDLIRDIDIFNSNGKLYSNHDKENIIRNIQGYSRVVSSLDNDTTIINDVKFFIHEDIRLEFQIYISKLFRLEVWRDKAIEFMAACGRKQKKDVDGLPLLHEHTPDNPLEYGKQLINEGYAPKDRIKKIQEKFPGLKLYEVGAYARGLSGPPTNERGKRACNQWVRDNKSKSK